MNSVQILLKYFNIPLLVLVGIIVYLFLRDVQPQFALLIILASIFLGSYSLFQEIIESLLKKQFALDYIAVLALAVSLITQNYLVGAVIALMLSTGRTLEWYGIAQAKKSLSLLVDRIPQDVILVEHGKPGEKVKIGHITAGQEIFIRKGEVIPLDGILVSESGYTDESSLTGEPYLVDKLQGDIVRSGTVNTGEAIIIKVTKPEKDSTYKKIIEMVKSAQDEKSPFIRLADKYSTFFTIVTLAIAAFAWFWSQSLEGILAVLVIATPCPLIIATPIALLGGVNKAAKRRIIVKKLASLEVLSRIDTIVFDKTGTLTLGRPMLTTIEIVDKTYTAENVLSISQALERNSLHPIAKTIIEEAQKKHIAAPHATNIEEKIGAGISGTIGGKRYTLAKIKGEFIRGMAIALTQRGKTVAVFHFEDVIKKESLSTVTDLQKHGLDLYIFTGDKKAVAEHIARQIDHHIQIKAEMKPEDKKKGIEELKKQNRVIGMVGDGINDAPALAKADVGLVFSNEEQTAASEAADIVLLGGDFSVVQETIHVAKRTIRIAKQSIFWGIGLSITGMVFAAFGYIPPIFGAGIQEAIDVAVIINALRASK